MRSVYDKQVQFVSPLPPGYTEATGQIARTYGGALAGIGDSIGNAIKQYAQNKEEREFLDQKFEMASSVLDKYKNNPELQSDPRVAKLVDGVGKFSSMSNTQKKAFLNNAEFAIAQFDKEEQRNYQREQDTLKNNLARQQAMFEALRLQSEASRTENDTRMTNAKIAEMNKTFTPSGSLVTLPDGTKVPVLMTSPHSAQPLATKPAPEAQSPLGKLYSDRDRAYESGDFAAGEKLQAMAEATVKKEAEGSGAKALTADQSNALNFTLRLNQNEGFLAKNKYDATAFWNGSWTPERLRSDEKKAYEAAKNNWIAAALRKESGAAISAKEYEDFDKQYFPQPGDGQKVVDQKSAMRAQVARAMAVSVGPEADKYMQAAALPQEPQGMPQFKTMAEAEAARAKGFKGVVEIYDPATNRYRRARID